MSTQNERFIEERRKFLRHLTKPAAIELLDRVFWGFTHGRMLLDYPTTSPNSKYRFCRPTDSFPHPRCVISLRDSERREESLVHELLHLDLFVRGYPVIQLNGLVAADKALATGIVNSSYHQPMRPLFLELGYDLEKFTRSEQLSSEHAALQSRIESTKELHAPKSFEQGIRSVLQDYSFSCTAMYYSEAGEPKGGA